MKSLNFMCPAVLNCPRLSHRKQLPRREEDLLAAGGKYERTLRLHCSCSWVTWFHCHVSQVQGNHTPLLQKWRLLFISMETTTTTRSTITLFDWAVLSYKVLFFNTVTTISYAFSSRRNKNLRAALVKICTSADDPLLLWPLLKCTTYHLTVLTTTV